jgi:undecaprenyl-diphosphatase
VTAWEAILLGLVQGLTEFLPISSSAHLRIVGELIGSSDPGAAFTAITQIGTEAAVIIYYRQKIGTILVAWFKALSGANGRGWRARVGLGPRSCSRTTSRPRSAISGSPSSRSRSSGCCCSWPTSSAVRSAS